MRAPFSVALLLALPIAGWADLQIAGVDSEIERNVRAFVALADEPCDAEDWRVRRRFRSVETEAGEALQPFGYYQATVSATLDLTGDCWSAQINIDPGPPVTLRDVEIAIDGAAGDDAAFSALKPVGLTPGDSLRHANYDRYKQRLQVLAADRGYIEAQFTTNRLDIWPAENAADVSLRFASGPRYKVGVIRQEQAFLDPELVSAYIDLGEDSYFDAREIARAYRDLSESGYFSRIEIVPEQDAAADGAIPIRVALQPGTRIEYTLGLGASTDTGPRFRAGFRNNRLNSQGHRLITDLNLSTVLKGLSGEYRRPLSDPRTDWMSYTAAISREDNDTFSSDTTRAGLRRSKRLNASWIRTLSLDVTFESYTVGTERNNSLLLLPAIAYDHKFADRDLYPDRGRRLGLALRGTSTAFGSDTSFVQTEVYARWIRALGANTRLLARATAGTTIKDEFIELPPSLRFFAGGDESVRGFDYESLGPTDADGNVIGGSNLLVASIEVERRLWGNYFGAVFVDAGNAFDDVRVDPAIGTGFGIKWRSPLGPVRLYFGFPITNEASGVRIHLRLGPDL